MTVPLQLSINGNVLKTGGWSYAEITAGIERVPRHFILGTTFAQDSLLESVSHAPAGQPCVITYDGVSMLTGYCDAVQSSLLAKNHEISYHGRGACQDVVDTSFQFTGEKIKLLLNVSIANATKQILASCGLNLIVEAPNAVNDPNKIINKAYISANVGDSSYTAIEQMNTYCGCILYEDGAGNFVMGQAGSEPASQTTLTHQNCITSQVSFDLAAVHSDYNIYASPEAKNQETFGKFKNGNYHQPIFDNRKNVIGGGARTRLYEKIVSGMSLDPTINYQQAYCNWFANRQMGLAQPITVTVIGWEDAQGQMWRPNQLVTVSLPYQNVPSGQLLVVECTYILSEDRGTVTRMLLMPSMAFSAAPLNVPLSSDLFSQPAPGAAATPAGAGVPAINPVNPPPT
jgi:prophage tail gpP-like protein